MSCVISICNHKGGVGKTTSVANLGSGLTSLHYRVLMVDLDMQSNLSQYFGLISAAENIYGALRGDYVPVPVKIRKNLELIPSSLDLVAVEIEFSQIPGRENKMKNLLANFKSAYDFVLIDCPPSLGLLTVNALTASDFVIVPLQTEYFALHGLNHLLKVIDIIRQQLNPGLRLGGIFLTLYDRRKILDRDIEAAMLEKYGSHLFSTRIRECAALAEAPVSSELVSEYDPHCAAAKDYLRLSKEIVRRISQTTLN